MKILITNDDGIESIGIKVLTEALVKLGHKVMVVAPLKEQSAVSSTLTLRSGLKIAKANELVPGVLTYTVAGTPVDCVKVAVHALSMDFELVISGINNGYNMGEDIIYSGTVAAGKEAVLYGKKSIALSCAVGTLAGFTQIYQTLFPMIFNSDIYKDSKMLNINIPDNPKEIKITRQGLCMYDTKYVLKDDLYYLNGVADFMNSINDSSTDVYQVMHGNVSVTPVTTDVTDYNVFEKYHK